MTLREAFDRYIDHAKNSIGSYLDRRAFGDYAFHASSEYEKAVSVAEDSEAFRDLVEAYDPESGPHTEERAAHRSNFFKNSGVYEAMIIGKEVDCETIFHGLLGGMDCPMEVVSISYFHGLEHYSDRLDIGPWFIDTLSFDELAEIFRLSNRWIHAPQDEDILREHSTFPALVEKMSLPLEASGSSGGLDEDFLDTERDHMDVRDLVQLVLCLYKPRALKASSQSGAVVAPNLKRLRSYRVLHHPFLMPDARLSYVQEMEWGYRQWAGESWIREGCPAVTLEDDGMLRSWLDQDYYLIEEKDAAPLRMLYTQIGDLLRTNQWLRTRINTPLRRFIDATNADASYCTERVVDYVICLESLLMTNEGGLKHKLASRCAMLCGRTDAERIEIFRKVKMLYDIRCRIVHGSDLPQELYAGIVFGDGFDDDWSEDLPHGSVIDDARQICAKALFGFIALCKKRSVNSTNDRKIPIEDLDEAMLSSSSREALHAGIGELGQYTEWWDSVGDKDSGAPQ